MKKSILAFQVLLLITFVINVRAASDNKNVDSELASEISDYKRTDNILNAAYQFLMEIYQKNDDKVAIAKLKTAQIAWIKYRDLAVSSETAIYNSKLEYYMSMSAITRQRTDRLKGMLEFMRNGMGYLNTQRYSAQAKKALDKIKEMEAKN